MGKFIESQALGPLNKTLGLGGSGDSQTELLDGIVNQTLDVGPIVRRGRTFAGSEGVFRVVLRNVHLGSGDLSSPWQPYLSAPVGTIAPYPTPMPDGYDVWLTGASLEQVSGGAVFNEGVLRVTNIQQGFGGDNLGAAVVSTSIFTLVRWASTDSQIPPTYGQTADGNPWVKIGWRMPRKGAVASPFVRFDTDASGIGTFDLVLLIAVLPSALGQDAFG